MPSTFYPSATDNQDLILRGIMDLHNGGEPFEVDATYGKGGFYKAIPEPRMAFDIDPQHPHVVRADCTELPLSDQTVGSIVFDPPFLTYVRNGRGHGSIMAERFGGYYTWEELAGHYQESLAEFSRVLHLKGLLVVKCQDIVHNHKLHPTHVHVHDWAEGVGFRLVDLFILYKKHRMGIPPTKTQKVPKRQRHARIHHSYFMVFRKVKAGPKRESLF